LIDSLERVQRNPLRYRLKRAMPFPVRTWIGQVRSGRQFCKARARKLTIERIAFPTFGHHAQRNGGGMPNKIDYFGVELIVDPIQKQRIYLLNDQGSRIPTKAPFFAIMDD
jgi:hypothetical protein